MKFVTPVSRPVVLAISGLLPVLLLGAASLTHLGAQEKPAKELASKKYKNIKVLKNLPADQLIPVMHQINNSLGVGCDFCHVIKPDHTGFELDDKPAKNVARSMVIMTDDLNKHQKILNKQATCYMCHHGKPEPETKAPANAPAPGQSR